MNGNKIITNSLLVSYLNNDVSDKERKLIGNWLNDENNRKHFQELKMIWEITAIERPKEVDVAEAWMQVKSKAIKKQNNKTTRLHPKHIVRIAALILLYYGVYNWNEFTTKKDSQHAIYSQQQTIPAKEEKENISPKNKLQINQPATPTATKKRNPLKENKLLATADHSKEEICNNTLCPLEICIIQSLQCDGKQTTFAHCSLLQPDEYGVLHYKSFDAQNCSSPVQEIRIKRVSTGETIILNNSTNLTAQNFFDYITGNKTGDIIAGIFETDCNNHRIDQSIKLDNTLGIPELR